ncbi:unnamed protein product [Urochloa humidicola]
MPPRRSARVARGRGRGRGGRGRGNNEQEVDNEAVVGKNNGPEAVPNNSAAGAAAAAGAVPIGAAPVAQAMTFTKWTSLQVEKFDGSGSPTDAADWLRKVEKVMNGCRMTPEDKVFFIPHQLTSLADLWWDGVCEAWPPSRGAITWEVFLEQFRAKYYPETYKDRMSDALNHIQQGSKTVEEYEREFTNIVRFVPTVARDEREKARKFFRGLNARYREVMGRNPPTTYQAAVDEARGMESEIQLTAIQQNRSGSASGTGGDKKRTPHEEGEQESSQRPPSKKFKQNHHSQSFKPRQSGVRGTIFFIITSCRTFIHASSTRTGFDVLQVWEASPLYRVYIFGILSFLWQGGTHGYCLQEKSRFHYQVAEVYSFWAISCQF